MVTIFALSAVVLALIVYFLPVVIASKRQLASGTGVVFFVNLLIGWTLIGWLVCLLWAALGQTLDQASFYAKNR